ncbi:hypothetical protein [Bacillus mycoides]|uniref:hypothetical protein n=1 Tax=Bacillus mycoides TaxID=1405 RepID=UPI003A80333C
MGKITWLINKFEDVEVYLGELSKQEMKNTDSEYYFHNGTSRIEFFTIINGYSPEYEVGDWDSAEFDERITDLYDNR